MFSARPELASSDFGVLAVGLREQMIWDIQWEAHWGEAEPAEAPGVVLGGARASG